MTPDDRVYVAGHRGLVGSALVRRLLTAGYRNLILRTHGELDLRVPEAVGQLFRETQPAYVFLAAARVGGILANDRYGGEFIRDNLLIQANVIDASSRANVEKLLFLGSSCIYPKHAEQPIREDALLSGALEPTNRPYAVAKIAGIEMVRAYRRQYGLRGISVMPTNLYGPNDNFDSDDAHVLPALIRRVHQAKSRNAPDVTVWGSGTPRREFLHVDDLADACLFLMRHYDDGQIINIGVGEDVTIRELASLVREVVGFSGELRFDATKPDGTPRKLLDVSRMRSLGWHATIPLRQGVEQTYKWYLEQGGGVRPSPAGSTTS